MRTAVALALWVAFSALSLAGMAAAFVAVVAQRWAYAKDLGRGMDRLGAAALGWGGDYTISAECGSRRTDCRFCRVVCRLLDFVQPGHCAGAAQHEHLDNKENAWTSDR